jgi:signal transduction histidine kinase/AraC-like DNA-binding protein
MNKFHFFKTLLPFNSSSLVNSPIFDKHEYELFYYVNSKRISQLSIILGILIYIVFIPFDRFLPHESQSFLFAARTIIFPPAYFAIFILSFTKIYDKHSQFILFIEMAIVANIAMLAIYFVPPQTDIVTRLYKTGTLLYIMVVMVFSRLHFWYALIAVSMHVFACIVLELLYHDALIDKTESIFFMILEGIVLGTILMGSFFNLFIENYILKDYINQKKLKEFDRTKSEFFANISHELRTPLTLMLAPVDEAIKGKIPGKEMFEMINRNGQNLLSLVNDLLDISRIDAYKMKLRISETNIGNLLTRLIAEMESVAAMRGITIVTEILPAQNVFIDKERFARIVSNFFSNSFKFTEPGGRIIVHIEGIDKSVSIEFTDTGTGISSDKIDNVFERFMQADMTSTRRHEGTGIGLSIVKEIVELHGGTVSVNSKHISEYPDEHGTSFTVKLPVGKDHFSGRNDVLFVEDTTDSSLPFVRGITPERREEKRQFMNAPVDAPVVLIVEDNPDMVLLLSGLIETKYRVITSYNGMQALEILNREDEIDLVLSDVMMPEMDGYEFVSRMRNDEKFRGIPVILLTAKAEMSMKLDGFNMGATDYIVKPFNAGELMARVEAQISMKLLRNRLVIANKKLYADLEKLLNRNRGALSKPVEKKLDAVVTFINANFTSNISRDGLACTVGMSPDSLSRHFKRFTGKRIDEFINDLRIGRAKALLQTTDAPVIRIALDCGFEEVRSFNRVFLNSVANTPSEFRKRR